MKNQQVVGLDVIRFFSATLVVLFHLTYWVSSPIASTPARITGGIFDFGDYGVSFGWVGVEVFFVLSGFVIAYSAAGAATYAFARSRILRLGPAAWTCATITLLFALASQDGSLKNIAYRYVNSLLFNPLGPWIDGVYWTLGIEASFYVLIAILLWSNRFALIEWIATALTAASFSLIAYHLTTAPSSAMTTSRITELLLIRHGCFFSIGIVTWLCYHYGFTTYRAGLLALSSLIGMLEIYYKSFEHDFGTHRSAPCALIIWSLFVVLIGVSCLANSFVLERTTASRQAAIRTLGLSTYPLYLIHQLVGASVMVNAAYFGLPHWACVVGAGLVTFLISLGVVLWIEPQVRFYARQALDRHFGPARYES